MAHNFLTTRDIAADLLDYLLQDFAYTPPAYPVLRIYTGAAPANVQTAATGTLLAELDCSDFAAATIVASPVAVGNVGRAPGNDMWGYTASALASGNAGYFRLLDANGVEVFQGTIGTAGCDLNLDSIAIVATAQIYIASFQITLSGIAA